MQIIDGLPCCISMGNASARNRSHTTHVSSSSPMVHEDNPLSPSPAAIGKLQNGWWCPTIENRLSSIDGVQLVTTLKQLDSLQSWPAALFPIVAGYAMRPYLV